MMATRRTLLACLGPTLLASALPTDAVRAQASTAIQPISALNQALHSAMEDGKTTPFPKRFDVVAPAVQRALNIPVILQTVVGLRWSQLPPDQQQSLLSVFRVFTIASYVANFDDPGGRLTISPQTRAAGADQIVQTQLASAGGASTRIDYVMRQGRAGWQAVDVLLDGSISRVAVQRSDFRSELRSGSAAPLIDSLRSKVRDLSGGTMTP